MVFADEDSPAFMAGAFEVLSSLWIDEPKVSAAFREGHGLGWHEHSACLFRGTERFFRPGYNANLVDAWLPALDGVVEKLEQGIDVADVGCGHGASTILMAPRLPALALHRLRPTTRPRSKGPRLPPPRPASAATPASRSPPPRSTRGPTTSSPSSTACTTWATRPAPPRTSARSLKPDGTWMIVEPFAGDALAENLNPVGRVYYAASTFICTPASLSQEVGLGLGAQAGEARLTEVVRSGGFTRVRRAAETPFNLVLEARP